MDWFERGRRACRLDVPFEQCPATDPAEVILWQEGYRSFDAELEAIILRYLNARRAWEVSQGISQDPVAQIRAEEARAEDLRHRMRDPLPHDWRKTIGL